MSASSISQNTILIFFKTLFNIVIAFYSTKLVLQNLGIEDYGVYNLVGGIVSLFSFLKASLSSSTQRFISHALGADILRIRGLFTTNVFLHLMFSIVVVILLLTIGSWGLGKLSIPNDKESVAQLVFLIVVIDTVITINSIPYEGFLVAKEKFKVITILGIFESLLKLGSALILGFIKSDRLVFYALLLVLVSLILRVLTTIYCKRNFIDSKVSYAEFRMDYAKEMISFIGWNTFGALCSIFRNQGVAIVLNLFFGVLINASYAIANQINSQLSFFSQSVILSVRPKLITAEGGGNRNRMIELSFIASKFSFYLLTFLSIPLIIQMPLILKLWLDINDSTTIEFSRLIIVLNLTIQLTVGLSMSMQAIGRIKWYQIVVGSTIMLSVPIGYFMFIFGYPPISILILAICIEVLASIQRLVFAKLTYGLSIFVYIKNVILPALVVFLISYFLINYLGFAILDMNDIMQILITTISSTIVICIAVLIFGLNKQERNILKVFVDKILFKLTWK